MDADYAPIESLRLTAAQWKAVGFLAEFSKRMVSFAFPGKKTPAAALNLIREVYRVTDDMLAGCLSNGTKLACKKGCFWCCYMRVKVTPLEMLCISDYLRSGLSPKELSEFQRRLAATDETTRGMDSRQRICAKMVCPLLIDDRCSVYPARPIACRVYHSLNLSDCEMTLDEVDRSITIRGDISGLGMGIFAGLTEGLRSVGLQTRILELIAGLRIVMDEGGSANRWLAGKPAFAEAEIEEAEHIESASRGLVENLRARWNELAAEDAT